jgi:hypothetical protein
VPAMRQRRRRAFDRGTGCDGQDSAGRVPAWIPGAAVRVPFTATIDGFPFAATVGIGVSLAVGIGVSLAVGIGVSLAVGIGVSLAAAFVGVSFGAALVGVSSASTASATATATATATAGVSAGVVAGAAAWIHRSAASRQVVRQLGEQRR